MNARRIAIESGEQEAELRARLADGVAVNVAAPTVAYACMACGTVLRFGDAAPPGDPSPLRCGRCGGINAIPPMPAA
jgi:hypothetical protein